MGQKDILELIAEHCQIRMRSNSFQLFGKTFIRSASGATLWNIGMLPTKVAIILKIISLISSIILDIFYTFGNQIYS